MKPGISRFSAKLSTCSWLQKRIALECSATVPAVNNRQREPRDPANHIFKFEQICRDAGLELPRHLFEPGVR